MLLLLARFYLTSIAVLFQNRHGKVLHVMFRIKLLLLIRVEAMLSVAATRDVPFHDVSSCDIRLLVGQSVSLVLCIATFERSFLNFHLWHLEGLTLLTRGYL